MKVRDIFFRDDGTLRRTVGVAMLGLALFFALVLPFSAPVRLGTSEVAVVACAENPGEAERIIGLAAEFQASHPGIALSVELAPAREIRARLEASDDKSPPGADVFLVEPRWLGSRNIRALLEPLSFEENGEMFLSRPLFSSIVVMVYNIDIMERAGLDRPPKTREEALRFAAAVAGGAEPVAGFSLSLADDPWTDLCPWFQAGGERLFAEGLPALDGKEHQATLRWLASLFARNYAAPGAFDKTPEEKLDDFRRGRAAIILAPVTVLAELGDLPFRAGISTVPCPAAYTGRPLFGMSGRDAVLSRFSRNKSGAREFIGFLAENAASLARAAGAVPGSLLPGGGGTGRYAGDDPLHAKAWNIYDAGEVADPPAEPSGGGSSARQDALFMEEFRRFVSGEQSAEECAGAIRRRWPEEENAAL